MRAVRLVGVVGASVLAIVACGGGGDKTAGSTTLPTQIAIDTSNTSVDVTTETSTTTINPTLPSSLTTVAGTQSSVPGSTLPKDSGTIVLVQKGDSLGRIASRLGVSTADLIALNGITDPNHLIVGQRLKVPATSTKVGTGTTKPGTATTKAGTTTTVHTPPVDSGKTYVVQAGDYANSIATKFHVRTADLLELNGITDPNKILVGKTLKIPKSR